MYFTLNGYFRVLALGKTAGLESTVGSRYNLYIHSVQSNSLAIYLGKRKFLFHVLFWNQKHVSSTNPTGEIPWRKGMPELGFYLEKQELERKLSKATIATYD